MRGHDTSADFLQVLAEHLLRSTVHQARGAIGKADEERRVTMRRKFIEPVLLGILLLGLTAFVAYQMLNRNGVPVTEKKSYSTDLKDLRTKFNQDKGKVRLLLLLSPT
jgi:hypothetical protein